MHIDGIRVGNPKILLNLIILNYDFIPLLYTDILSKVGLRNVQITLSGIISMRLPFGPADKNKYHGSGE
jgi:hypothetical protein